MSFSLLTAAARSARLKAGLWSVFMISVGSCVQAQTKIAPTTPVIAGGHDIIHDAGGDIYLKVDRSANFTGGMNAFYHLLSQNIKYPEVARKNNVQGKVFVNFVVEKDGTLSNFKILHGIGSGCDEEAIRVLKRSPKWQPGTKNKQAVRQQFTVPINFSLASNKPVVKVVPPPPPMPPNNVKESKRGTDDNEIFNVVEHPAEFPGEKNAIYKYLAANIHYPEAARNANVQGKVYVTFVVEKDGSLSDVKALRGPGKGLNEEAVRVMTASPKWKPGKQNGHVVREQFTVPINFTLADK